jgi:hypothetical protein
MPSLAGGPATVRAEAFIFEQRRTTKPRAKSWNCKPSFLNTLEAFSEPEAGLYPEACHLRTAEHNRQNKSAPIHPLDLPAPRTTQEMLV